MKMASNTWPPVFFIPAMTVSQSLTKRARLSPVMITARRRSIPNTAPPAS